MKQTGFLFDLDGVIIDSESEYTKIWSEINRQYPSGKDNLAYIIKGQTLSKILNDNFPPEKHEEVKSLLHRLENEMRYDYCEGAESFLEALNERRAPIALVTSSDEVKMAHLYEEIPGFRQKIGHIIDASRVKRSKPDPEGYLTAAASLGVDIRHCVVFEDSVQGVMAGRASGAYVVGIEGTKKREEIEPYADVVVKSLQEIDIEELTKLLENR